MTLTELQTYPGVRPLTPAVLNCRGFLLTHAPPNIASTMNFFFAGVNSICGAQTSEEASTDTL